MRFPPSLPPAAPAAPTRLHFLHSAARAALRLPLLRHAGRSRNAVRLATAALVLLLLAGLLPQAASASAPAKSDRPVQVFDVRAGKVVQSFPNEDAYQQIARSWLDAAEGLSPNLSPDDDCGYVFRIPLREPASLKVGRLHLRAEDVFLFYCPEREPELLVFDERKKPYLLTARPDLRPFFERIGFEP